MKKIFLSIILIIAAAISAYSFTIAGFFKSERGGVILNTQGGFRASIDKVIYDGTYDIYGTPDPGQVNNISITLNNGEKLSGRYIYPMQGNRSIAVEGIVFELAQ